MAYLLRSEILLRFGYSSTVTVAGFTSLTVTGVPEGSVAALRPPATTAAVPAPAPADPPPPAPPTAAGPPPAPPAAPIAAPFAPPKIPPRMAPPIAPPPIFATLSPVGL